MRQPSFRGLIAAFGDVGEAWVVAYHVMQNRTITTATIAFEIRLRAAAARSSRNKSVTGAFNASGTASTTNTNRLTPMSVLTLEPLQELRSAGDVHRH